MGETFVNVTEGSGKKLWAYDWSVGANTVLAEAVHAAPYPYATYLLQVAAASGATANDHDLCLNAGASLKVRVHRIRIRQVGAGAALASYQFNILRTTTAAPTGGTAITPAQHDTTDAASGAAGRSIPGVKGTESTIIFNPILTMQTALPTSGMEVWEWRAAIAGGHGKPIIIPAGTANGLVIKNITASAGVTWNMEMEFTEVPF